MVSTIGQQEKKICTNFTKAYKKLPLSLHYDSD